MYYFQQTSHGAFRLMTDMRMYLRTNEPYVKFRSYDALLPWMQERVTVLDLMPEGKLLHTVGVRMSSCYYLLFSFPEDITCMC